MPLAQRRDYHQTIEFAGIMELGGWRSVALPAALVFVQRTATGAFAKMQRAARIDLDALDRLSKAQGIDELHVEPGLTVDLVREPGAVTRLAYTRENEESYVAAFASAGLVPVAARWAHSKTLALALHATHDELLAALDKKTRWEIKQASALHYETRAFDEPLPAELAAVHARWLESHRTYDAQFLASVRRCFATRGALLLVRDERELLAAAHVLFVDRVAIYFDAFSAPAARDGFANAGLVLEAARVGRERGCDVLDLCACWDERYPDLHPDWRGFTTFKEKFASTAIYYPPTFTYRR